MKRRDFIKTGSAGLAGMALGGLSAQAANAGRRASEQAGTWKKGFMLGTFSPAGDLDLKGRFRLLKEAGFDGVEPSSGMDRDEVLRARDESGLEIPSVVVATHWSQPLSSPDPDVRAAGLEGLKTALRDAKAYGAQTVLLVPGVVNASIFYDDAYRRSQREIRKAVPLAEEIGVVIAVENVWNRFLLSPLEAARYVDEFESPYVGWYFDIGNIRNYGWPEQWIRILGERIAMVHLKEYSMEKRNREGPRAGFRVNFLEGDNDWAAIMRAFRDIGYGGYGIAEPPHRDPDLADDVWLTEYVSDRMDEIFRS